MDRDSFVLENVGLVRIIANNIYNKVKDLGFQFDDLYQVGMLTLLERYNEYNSSYGKVSTFITMKVTGEILNYISKNSTFVHVPHTKISHSVKIKKYIQLFYLTNNRNPSTSEILEYSLENIDKNIDIDDVVNYLYICRYCFNDKRFEITQFYEILNKDDIDNSKEYILLEETLKDSTDLESEIIDKVILENVLDYIKRISPDINCFKAYIEKNGICDDDPKTYDYIGKKQNITYEGARKRIKKVENRIENHKEKIKRLIYE